MAQQRQYVDHADRQRAYRLRQEQARRDALQEKGLPPAAPVPTMPSRARWQVLIGRAQLALETARDEMQAYYDERSETWQQGERAAALEEEIAQLDGVLEDLDALSDG
jgi:hypothetical protein